MIARPESQASTAIEQQRVVDQGSIHAKSVRSVWFQTVKAKAVLTAASHRMISLCVWRRGGMLEPPHRAASSATSRSPC